MASDAGKGAPEDPDTARLVSDAGAGDAWRLAASAHAGQVRSADHRPYIEHPERVASLVAANGGDNAMIAAALLHDVLEDSPTEPPDIEKAFGPEIAGLVVGLSDDRSITDYAARKRDLREQVRSAGARAALIYAADKLANCSDLRRAYAEIGEGVADRIGISLDLRVAIWREDCEMCRELLGEADLVVALVAELDALEADRARERV